MIYVVSKWTGMHSDIGLHTKIWVNKTKMKSNGDQYGLFSSVCQYFVNMCIPWELNPQPFALLTQCSTTEPQEHYTEYGRSLQM